MANETAARNTGKVVQIIGPVIDVEFAEQLPAIYNALQVKSSAGGVDIDLIAEVAQHLGENRVRAVAMKATDGMQRGMEAVDLGQPISVPVGPEALAGCSTCSESRSISPTARCRRRSGGRFTGLRRS